MSGLSQQRQRAIALALIVSLVFSGLAGFVRPHTVVAAGEPPMLVLTPSSTSNPLSAYVTEILAAEGFDNVEVRSISNLNSALLVGRSVVIVCETSITTTQINLLNNYVMAGGGLIAMRPVSGLNATLGVTAVSGTTSEGYMRITDGTIGAGLYSDTMQFHGTASHYTLQSGTTQVAELYSSRTASASRPAATIATRGNGRAAMFAYDLGRSVALTRQGNPSNANLDTDGDGVRRTIDLYRNWTDLQRTSVPQADVQGRLLSRLIEAVSPQPLPRLWFFPGTAPSVLIATADAHANPDAYYQSEISDLNQHATTSTFYMTQAGQPSAANVAAWRALGFDFSIHPVVDCGYACGIDAVRNWLQNTYGITPRTSRTHQVRWTGWTDAASIQAARGIQMDFNSYQWGPWLTNAGSPALGYLNGGGLPMRFVESNGNILSIYQQHTSLVDEFIAPQAGLAGLSLQQAVAASQATIDAAIDLYHVPIATQFHVDYFYPTNSDWATQTADYARTRGAVSMTADAWLAFTLERAATAMSNSSWSNNTLTFSVAAGGGNQTLLLPLQHRGGSLTGVTRNGSSVSFTTLAINGTTYAAVSASSGTYAATYAADTTPPQINGIAPASGATAVPVTTPITVTFSEVMQQAASQASFAISPGVAGSFSWNGAGTTMTFTPSVVLAGNTQYTVNVSTNAKDLAGNAIAATTSWSFTTAANAQPPAVTSVSPISGPISGGTIITISGTNLTGTSAVRFGNTNASSFTVVNETTITATAPAGSAGPVHVTVTTPAGTSPAVAEDQFTYIDASSTMSIVSVDPGTGPTTGGTIITITGSGFASGATVTVGGTPATNVTVLSTTRITARVPSRPVGVANVVVSRSGGGSATLANGFSYVNCANLCTTQSTTAAFATGTTSPETTIIESTDGEVSLAPTVGTEFSGNSVPASWSTTPWTTGGGALVTNGSVVLDAALLTSGTFVTPGRALEFVATFTSGAHQHIGLGIDLNNTPWAIFSTGPSGGALFARTNSSGGTDTQISGSWLGAPHHYRIEWTSTNVTYFIDSVQVATHSVAIPGEMRLVASDGPLGGPTLSIDWMRLTPYASSGAYTSRVIDSGGDATWQTIYWSSTQPTGTSLAIAVRAGNSPSPDDSWSAFLPVSGNGAALGMTGRYMQYQLSLATTNPGLTPELRDLTIAYSVNGTLAPAISSIEPASGPTLGGTVVTISGANFAAGASVTFDGIPATNVNVTATTITATTPAHAAGAVHVVVTNPDTQSGILTSGYTYVAGQPTITSIAPNAGPTTGGTSVLITGTNLTDATSVSFGGLPATSYTVDSNTQITAVAPAQGEGVVDIRVTTAGGTSPIVTGDRFSYIVLPPSPVITSIDPGTGPVTGGGIVEIRGANFGPGVSVRFGGNLATSLTVVSTALITATVPAGVVGTANVTIISPSGQQNTLVGGYTYVICAPACLSDTTMAHFMAGQPAGTSVVSEVADGEVRLAAEVTTDFSNGALPTGWNSALWTTSGSVNLAGGQLSVDSAFAATDVYYTPDRSLEFVATFNNGAFQHVGLGLDLNSAPWMIFSTGSTGTNLYARSNSSLPGTDTLVPGNWLGSAHRFRIDWTATTATYFIDGLQVAQHTIASIGEVRPIISDGPPGGASVSVDWLRVTPYTSTASWESRVFDAGVVVDWSTIAWSADLPAETSLSLSVRAGDTPAPDETWSSYSPVSASGTTLEISSQYLQYRVDFTSEDPAQTPALRDVIVAYGGSGTAPTVTGISPATGLTTGGTVVTITGSGFSGTSSVSFAGAQASFTVISDGQIEAIAPTNAAGQAEVIVTTAFGTSEATPAAIFTYTSPVIPLTISSVSPAVGSTSGGTAITVTGTGFVTGTRIVLGTTEATNVIVVDGTTLTATTRSRSAGTVSARVIKPDGTSATLASAFTYATPPSISSVSPSDGSTAGGRVVTINGSNFVNGATVAFDGLPGTSVTFVNSTTIRATTPAHAAGQVIVTVTNPSGLSGTRTNGFTYVTPVTAAAAAPTSGQILVGDVDGGSINSLATNNGSYLIIDANPSGSARVASFYGEYTVPSARRDLVGLTIAYDGSATTSGVTRTISLWNWNTSAWVVLRTEAQPTSDLLSTIVVNGDPLQYMASNGRIRMRIELRRTGNTNFDLRADMMSFTVTYIP